MSKKSKKDEKGKQKVDVFKLKNNMEFWNKYVAFHGETMNDFYRPRKQTMYKTRKKRMRYKFGKIECWIKVQIMVISFYMSNDAVKKGLNFFMMGQTIHERLLNYGNKYDISTVYKGIKMGLELGFFTEEKITEHDGSSDESYFHRKLLPNWDTIEYVMNIYDMNDPYLVALKEKEGKSAEQIKKDKRTLSLLTKFIKKRPYSLTKGIENKCKEYTENGSRRKPYKNSTEMFVNWTMKVSSKYYYSNKLTLKFIPDSLKNRKEVLSKAFANYASPYGRISKDDIETFEAVGVVDPFNYVGWKVPNALEERALKLGFELNKKGFIQSYRNPKKYDTGGFETLDDVLYGSQLKHDINHDRYSSKRNQETKAIWQQ